MHSGLGITLVAASGLGTHHGTTAVMDTDGTTHGIRPGTIIRGITDLGITAGTIPGTTDGTTHTTARGDGLTMAITAGIRLITMVAITTTMVAVAAEVTTTDVLAMRAR